MQTKHTSNRRITIPLWCESPRQFPSQRATNVESISISWYHSDMSVINCVSFFLPVSAPSPSPGPNPSPVTTPTPTTLAPTCGGVFTELSGDIFSPNYPNNYPTNILCRYNITVPEGYVSNKVWWLCLVPTSTTRFASDVGYRMAKIKHSCTRKIFFMNNDI